MNGTAVARNDRSENSDEPESAQYMRLSSEEREVICELRALQFGELRVIRRDGRLSHMVTEVTKKFGLAKPAV